MAPVREWSSMVDLDVGGGLVDVVVNGVPLAILLLFAVVFLVVAPWGVGGLATALQLGIILGTAVALVAITYRGNRLIMEAPGERTNLTTEESDREGETDRDGEVREVSEVGDGSEVGDDGRQHR